MGRKTKAQLAAEKEAKDAEDWELRGKSLDTESAGTETARTTRKQAAAARKSTEQDKRAGKKVAVSTNEESDEGEEEPAPAKKAKMSKGKGVAVARDREKTPSVEELYDHLLHGIAWSPTRFADLELLKALEIDSDMEEMLGHLKMPKILTMAYPTYKEVSCQFLSSLEVTYHETRHVRQGWGKIKFKVNGRVYNMNFKDIGILMGFQDGEEPTLPRYNDLPENLWKLISGNKHKTGGNKNSMIRHPTVRYLHRLLVHLFYPRKQHGNCTEEDLRLLCPAIRPYTTPGQLPLPSTDIYAQFGMVGFFVSRLQRYRDWAWTTDDKDPKIGIGGMITPLLEHQGIHLGNDGVGPSLIDGAYLKLATYFSGMYEGNYVYYYRLKEQNVEVLLPNQDLTSLVLPGVISFDLAPEDYLGEHGTLDPIVVLGRPWRPRESAQTVPDRPAEEAPEPVYGPRRYYFKPYDGTLPPGALRDAHEHIGRLQRWNKAQDRTIMKLKDKCKALSKTVKKQAKTSAKFMKKVVDVLTKGGVAGCSSADFAFMNTTAPQPRPQPQPMDVGFPLTEEQRERKNRNPWIGPSTSGNMSPSLASSDDEDDIAEVQSQSWYGHYSAAPGGYYTSFPPDDDDAGASAPTY